jgi:uroporphyrinogen decarboxylase
MLRKTMTSRERVLKTLEHQEPDRVPFNLALTVDIYHSLRNYLGLPLDLDKSAGLWTDVSLEFDLIEAMNLDFCHIGLNPPGRTSLKGPVEWLQYDEWGIGRTRVIREDGSYYNEMVYHPLANATLEDVQNYPWPDPDDPAQVEGLRQKALRLRRDTEKAIIGKFANSIWEQSWWLYGMEAFLVDLYAKPEVVCAIMDKVTEIAVGRMEAGMETIGDLVDIVRLSGEDLGTQNAPMISPKLFHSMVQPRFSRLWNAARSKIEQKNPAAKLMLHSCGNVRPFLATWIEMGLNILDPIQPRARGMEPMGLKKDFGEQLIFHGGIDLQHTLPFGTPEEVQAEVRRYIQTLGPGGGYIVSPAHNVQSDVPPANLVAIRDTVEAYGNYPIKVSYF